MGKWTRQTGFDALIARGATMLIANPPILQDVLDEAQLRGFTPPALRMSMSGGGPVAPVLKAGWRESLKPACGFPTNPVRLPPAGP